MVGSRANVESPAKRGTTVASAGPRGAVVDPSSVIDGLIHQGPQLRPERISHRWLELCHENGVEVFGRIDPECRTGRAAPVEVARRARHRRGDRPETHREAQAESDAVEAGFAEPADGH